jgi:hypothetical protein
MTVVGCFEVIAPLFCAVAVAVTDAFRPVIARALVKLDSNIIDALKID